MTNLMIQEYYLKIKLLLELKKNAFRNMQNQIYQGITEGCYQSFKNSNYIELNRLIHRDGLLDVYGKLIVILF